MSGRVLDRDCPDCQGTGYSYECGEVNPCPCPREGDGDAPKLGGDSAAGRRRVGRVKSPARCRVIETG